MLTSDKNPRAKEFFTSDRGKRVDADLHEQIIADGKKAWADSVSHKVARRLGLSEEAIASLMKPKPK